ncbi:MFS transporter [Bifidobacterium primatium]|uniref:MFS transporter n=2 Tax=Bifidobacterium primatium TaxID=2045438 RepID=A0A2M9HAQ8_9BIFI|nr:MFS transporter [Bifidobacterium primatium]PJM73902.1 MFS transporter [Bifidobacterium primatium]
MTQEQNSASQKNVKSESSKAAAKSAASAGRPALRDDRFFTLPVISLVSMSFLLGMSEFIIVGILPDIAEGLNVSLTTVGGLVSLFAFVYAPATPIGASISSRFERFRTLLFLAVVFLIGNLMCAFAVGYGMLVAARIVIALISGTTVAISMTFADDVATQKNRTKFVAWVFSGFSIASVFGVPIGTSIANTFGWRWSFHVINILTVVLIVIMCIVLPKNHYGPKSRFLAQFFIFTEKRIWGGILAVVFAAASTYVFYTYLTPILEQEIGIPARYISLALAAYGVACLASNLYGGRLGDRGRGVVPLVKGRPIYLIQAVFMVALPFAVMNGVIGCVVLLVLGFLMYLQNTASQVLYMDVAAATHPGSLNLASSFNSMSFNIGIALGSAVGSLVTDHVGLRWLGPFGAVFAVCAWLTAVWLNSDLKRREAAAAKS